MMLAARKELLVRAKYEALESAGGKGAVKKAIEKKQKKINQKEKKKRPFGPGNGGGGGGDFSGARKRPRDFANDRPAGKRQRFS